MQRTIHLIAGLPRAGSTLLCNLLAQNPRFHATSTSGIISIMRAVRVRWPQVYGEKNPQAEAAMRRVLGGILDYYHDDPNNSKPVIFDKSRGWIGALDMAEMALGRKVKVLVCVRDVRDVIASFEKLWRKDTALWQLSQERSRYFDWQTIEGRCEVWMGPKGVVGIPYRGLRRALERGYRDRMFFMEFDDLTRQPRATMQRVYEFIGEPYFEHDFDHVEQVTREDDFMHGIPGLHVIRSKVAPFEPVWPQYLGKAADKYASLNSLWRDAKPKTAETKTPSSSAKPAKG
jgi:sulfotransferase